MGNNLAKHFKSTENTKLSHEKQSYHTETTWKKQNTFANKTGVDLNLETIITCYFGILFKEFSIYYKLENGIINIIKMYLQYPNQIFITEDTFG